MFHKIPKLHGVSEGSFEELDFETKKILGTTQYFYLVNLDDLIT